MPPIELAAPADLDLLATMRTNERWLANRWLLDLLHHWERARLFVIRPHPEGSLSASLAGMVQPVLGSTSAVAYGDLGIVGNVLIYRAYRRRGLGRELMRAAIAWLADQGVRRIELDATVEGRSLYEQLGFIATLPSWVLRVPLDTLDPEVLAAPAGACRIAPLRADDLRLVAALDPAALGGDRLGLLAGMLGLDEARGYVALDAGGEPAGYAVLRPPEPGFAGLHIGPLVARAPEVALALLAHILRVAVPMSNDPATSAPILYATVPGASRAALELYASLGLPLIEDDLRMYLELPPKAETGADRRASGESRPPGLPDWVYAMLAPMVG